MFRKKYAITTSLLLSASGAQADMSLLDEKAILYGFLATSPQYENIDSPVKNKSSSRTRLVDQSSRIGFKGESNIDENTQAFWRAEYRVRVGSNSANGTNDASSGLSSRPIYLGVKGNYGKVQAGKFYDVYDDWFPEGMKNIEETSGGIGQFVHRGAGQPTSVVAYISPVIKGFKITADYDFGSDTTTANAHGVAATLSYKYENINIGYQYKQNTNSSTSTADYSTSNLSNSNSFTAQLIGGNIEIIKDLDIGIAIEKTTVNGTTTQVGYGVGFTYTWGKYSVHATYGLLDDSQIGSATQQETGARGANLGMTYKVNKNLEWLSGIGYVLNEANASLGTNTAKSLAPDGSTTLTGTKVTTFSVGARYTF
ncbi:porin [Curvibacter sp. CHRR-16]|uniref:porin n=1 Tax=Curvibacter sp. CHRR-16 TaxID=2835872 RepID=UPI001BD94BEB|nr:porin [Curvibacter sp. CHRR-16]MBT0569946.1 porin [Curvibacter sp. CHRR-16]